MTETHDTGAAVDAPAASLIPTSGAGYATNGNAAPVEPDTHGANLASRQLAILSPQQHAALTALDVAALTLPALVDHLLKKLGDVDSETGELSTALAEAIDALNLGIERKVGAYAH